MKEPFRLLIAVPCTDYMHADFVKSLMALQAHLQREGISHRTEILPGTLVYMARNTLACMAINENYTHILFLDSDMVFDESIVETLRFSKKAFICGSFNSRRPPYGPCIYQSLKPMEKAEVSGLEPFKIAGCGMACTMISTEIIKEVQNKYGSCFNPDRVDGVNYGEDLAFCRRAAEIGAEMWCEPTASVGHIAHITIWPGEEPAR